METLLEKKLRQLSTITPSFTFKKEAKQRLLNKISQTESFGVLSFLQKIFKPQPSSDFIIMAKVRLLHRIEIFKPSLLDILSNFLYKILFQKKLITILTIVSIILSTFTIPNTKAETKNEIWVNFGTIEVKSNGNDWQKINKKYTLKKGDKVKSHANTLAEIHFIDKSLIRVSENTILNIADIANQNETNHSLSKLTIVQLQEGRLWANFLLKKLDNNLYIETRDSRISSDYGIFDVEFNQQTIVKSIQNSTKIEARSQKDETVLLSAGFQTAISNQDIDIQPLEKNKDSWHQENQLKDNQLKTELIATENKTIKDTAGILPNHPLYEINQIVENIHLDDFEKIKKDFASSKMLMNINEKDLAIKQFEQAMVNLSLLWTKNENQTENQTKILAFIEDEKIAFANILPEDSLFPLKKYYQQMFISYANNPQKEKLNQINENMLEIQNLITTDDKENGNLIASLDEFTNKNTKTMEDLLADNDNNSNNLKQLLSMQNQNLQVLQSLSNNIEGDEVKTKTSELKKELVNTINKIVNKIAPDKGIKQNVNQSQAEWLASQVQIMVDKVNTYESKKGRTNTIYWILKDIPDNKDSLSLLYMLKDMMPSEVQLDISNKILQIRQQEK